MNYNVHSPTNEFLDSFASNSFLPYILEPTRITSRSKTLIDNIFTSIIFPDSISSNLTATISEHLPQFLIVPNIFSNPLSNKSNIYERDWSNFDQENFILDYFSIDWNETPWITPGLQKSVSVKNKFLSDFIKKGSYY